MIHEADVIVGDQPVGVLTVVVSVRTEDRPFLRLFNVALLVAGLVSVAVVAGVSVWLARRQTRGPPRRRPAWRLRHAGTSPTRLVDVVGTTRLQRAAWIAVCLTVLVGVLLWMLLTLTPLRSSRLGPFARGFVTPAAALAATKREHPSASWPMFGGSPSRVRYAASPLRPPFRIAQIVPGESLIEMSPAVAGGVVVFGTHDGTVIAARSSP